MGSDYSACAPVPDQEKEKKRAHKTRQNSRDHGGGGTEQSTAEHEGHGEGPGHVRGDGAHHCERGPWLQVVHQAEETPHQPRCKEQVGATIHTAHSIQKMLEEEGW